MKKGDIQYSDYSLNNLKLINVGEKLRFEVDTDGTLMDSLVAFWKLDEIGNGRHDALGKHHLTDNNRVSAAQGRSTVNGVRGNAAHFTRARSQYLSIADNAELSTGDIGFTISAWVYLKSKNNHMWVASKVGTTTQREWTIYYDTTLDRFRFRVSSDGSAWTHLSADSLGAVSVNTWYHIVCWHDPDANTINIQVNNGTADSTAHTGGATDQAGPFQIGAENGDSTTIFDGRIDDVGFWKKVLTSQERTDLYNSGNGNTVVGKREPLYQFDTDTSGELLRDLVAYWKLDETPPGAVATTRYDFVGLNHLTDNATVTQAAGRVGQAGQFTAANSEYLSITDNADLSGNNSSLTITAWIYADSLSDYNRVVSKWGGANNADEYQIFYDHTVPGILWYVRGSTSATNVNGGSLNTGQWYFVVAWHDATNDEIGIQINNGTPVTATKTDGIKDTSEKFYIGATESLGSVLRHWNGRIDEVGFWKRVLTSAEKTDLYNSGNGQTIVDKNKQAGTVNKRFKIDTNGTLLTNLVAYWKLDEISGVRRDEIGSSDLTDNATVTWKHGKQGRAGQFTRANLEYLSIADNASLSTGDIDFSASVWIYLDDITTSVYAVLAKGDPDPGREWGIIIDSTSGIRFYISVDGSALSRIASKSAPAVGQWHHIIVWHDAAANEIGISLNNDTPATTATAGDAPSDRGNQFTIGGATGFSGGGYFNGRIDEVGFWKKVLTSQERTDLYNSGLGNTLVDEEGAL